ncbi:MAG: hypothetical protein FWG21_00510 [Oscillospiraceae bacterium]|nr:hypothetical protein [Oscillospiraceae bacterium]
MKSKISLIDISLIGIAAALMIGVQLSLAFLPNIELITLLIILFTLHFKSRTIYMIYVFSIVECLIYPFGLWCFTYLYIWTILYIVVWVLKDSRSALFWAVIGAVFGLLYGSLSSIPYFITMGLAGGIAYIVSGLSFDLLHCFGNFMVIILLFKPLNTLLGKLPYISLESRKTD